jgi:hypothetical protein
MRSILRAAAYLAAVCGNAALAQDNSSAPVSVFKTVSHNAISTQGQGL